MESLSRPIYVDVTHTATHPFNTGVQRVVRKLAEQALSWPNCQLIRLEEKSGTFVTLSKPEIDQLLTGWDHMPKPDLKKDAPSRYRSFLKALDRFGFHKPLALLKGWIIDQVLKRLSHWFYQTIAHADGVDFHHAIYLTAEVFVEQTRVKATKKIIRTPFCYTYFIIHDLIPVTHPHFSTIKKTSFCRYLRLLPNATGVITVSDYTLVQLYNFLRSGGHLLPPVFQRLYNGFDRPTSEAEEQPTNRLSRLSFFFLCIGTIEARKNQVKLLPILEELWQSGEQFQFVFAGNQAEHYEEFQLHYNHLKKKEYPIFQLGHVSEKELNWLYRHAVATVYISLVEGYGLPIIESVARGTPCITSNSTGTGEVAKEIGGCVVIEPNEREALKRALSQFIWNPELRRNEMIKTIHMGNIKTWHQYAIDIYKLLEYKSMSRY